jgi:hypothetical protein
MVLTPTVFAVLNVLGAREGTIQQQLSTDMGLLALLRRALASAPPQPPWRAEERD